MKNEKEIISKNKLLAQFEGANMRTSESLGLYFIWSNESGVYRKCSLISMKYHTEWPWLMPVVQKIFDLHFKNGPTEETPRVLKMQIYEPIENIWEACCEYVGWYNDTKSLTPNTK